MSKKKQQVIEAEVDEREDEPAEGGGIVLHRVEGWALGVVAGEDEPRIRDVDLGERLGYDRPRDLRKLAERYGAAKILNDFDLGATVARTAGGVAQREYTVFWLTLEAALFLAAKSETRIAVDITKEMIRVFIAARRGLAVASQQRVGQIMQGNAVELIVADTLRSGDARAQNVLRRNMENFARQAVNARTTLAMVEGDWDLVHRLMNAETEVSRAFAPLYGFEHINDRLAAVKPRVLAEVKRAPAGITTSKLAQALGEPPGDVYVVLEHLRREQQVYASRYTTDGRNPVEVTLYHAQRPPLAVEVITDPPPQEPPPVLDADASARLTSGVAHASPGGEGLVQDRSTS